MTRLTRMAAALAIGAVIVAPAVPTAQMKPDIALRAAMETETVKGDLKGAIEQYKKLAQSSDRVVAATALLRMAECYQKLGDAESNRIYERIVREFADQKETAALARARLAGSPTTRSAVDRVVKAGETITYGEGRVSPDGRFISYVDDWFTGNLMLHDLSGGPDRALTTSKDWGVGSAYSSTFSPDGKQIAFGWRTFGKPAVNELRVMGVDAVGLEQSRRLATSLEVDVYDATDWSADGRWLAVTLQRKDRTRQIGVVGVQDGSFRPLKTIGWRGPNKVFFSPDGKYLVYDLPASDGEAQRDVFILAIDGTRETRAVEHSANDVVMAWTADGTRVLFASDRTGAVALWELPVVDGKPSGAPVLLKPNIGTVFSFGLTASGVLHVLRDASTVGLHVAPIDLESGKLTGPPVLESFRSDRPDWSRDGKQLAYGVRNASDQRVLMIRSVETGQVRELRPRLGYFPEPRWTPDGRSFITGGRDFQGRDGIYRIDAQTGNETFIAESGQTERVQISPDGQKIYYTTEGNSLLVERDLVTGTVRSLFRPRVRVGAPDLSPDGKYVAVAPLDWEAKNSTLVLVPVGGGEARTVFEVSKPDAVSTYGGTAWTGDGTALVVVKSDERYVAKEIWLVPVNGDKPRKLDIDVRSLKGLGAAGGIRLHPSGKQIAFFLGSQYREVWALESLQPALKAKKQGAAR